MVDPREFADMFKDAYVDTLYFDAIVSDTQGTLVDRAQLSSAVVPWHVTTSVPPWHVQSAVSDSISIAVSLPNRFHGPSGDGHSVKSTSGALCTSSPQNRCEPGADMQTTSMTDSVHTRSGYAAGGRGP